MPLRCAVQRRGVPVLADMKPVSPAAADGDLLTFSITANGNALDGNLLVIGVDVWSAVNAVPKAKVVLRGGTLPDEPFSPSDFEALQPGKAIEIRAGYDAAPDAIFSGIVVAHGIELAGDGPARVVVDAAGHAVTMTASRKTAVFTAVTDTALVGQLISSSGLTPDVGSTTVAHDAVVQNDATDWDFVVLRAGINGMLVTTDAGTVTVKAPDTTQLPVLTVAYGESILAFKAEMEPRRSRLAGARGQVSFQGSALARPGSRIELVGVGGPFNGSVLMSAVHHDIAQGRWTTSVEFGHVPDSLEPASLVSSTAAGPAVPIRGLQRGLVQQVSDDPAGALRVLVALPLVGSGAALWARLASFYASDAAGAVFYPEVGDDVIVGFLDDDPRFPIVLGSVYGTTRPPAALPDAGNRMKAIVTRSKLEVRFDDRDRVITIRTPGQQVISLNDTSGEIHIADANQNSVTLGSRGIRIDSTSNLAITATGHIEMKAGAGLALQATGNLSCQGLRVDLEADTALRAHGRATADLASAGVVTVQGALVKIN